jgi:hypothetical protein
MHGADPPHSGNPGASASPQIEIFKTIRSYDSGNKTSTTISDHDRVKLRSRTRTFAVLHNQWSDPFTVGPGRMTTR